MQGLKSYHVRLDWMDGILYSVPVMDFLSINIAQCWEHLLFGRAHLHNAAICLDAFHKCNQGACRCEVNPGDETKVQNDTFGGSSELLPEMLNTWEGKIRLGTENSEAVLLGQLDARFGLLVEEKGQMEQRTNNQTHLHTPEEAKDEGYGIGEQVQLCK